MGKIFNSAALPLMIREEYRRPVVFTNGVYDILHRGHVEFLQQAKQLGATLIVALNSDKSAASLGKGPGRPFNTLDDRAAVIAALECVDFVTWFHEIEPSRLVLELDPDVLVKGGDWSGRAIAGAGHVRAKGGLVATIPFVTDRSTTKLIERIRA